MKFARLLAMAFATVAMIASTGAHAAPKYSSKVRGLVAPPGKCGVNFYWSKAACKCLDARWKTHYPNW